MKGRLLGVRCNTLCEVLRVPRYILERGTLSSEPSWGEHMVARSHSSEPQAQVRWGVQNLSPVLPWQQGLVMFMPGWELGSMNTQPCPPMEAGTGDVYVWARVGSVNTQPCPPMEAGTGDVYVWVRVKECEHSTLSSHGSRDWWCLCLGESGECEN